MSKNNPTGKDNREGSQFEEPSMPLMVHLREMRDRLVYSVIALAATTAIAFFFVEEIVQILKMPAGDVDLIAIELTENLGVFLRVSLAGGFILSMPFLIYQLFAFVAPALTDKEKRYVFTISPFVAFMFFAGVAFAYFVALPPAMNFLFNFMTEVAETEIRISNYLMVITRLILGLGLVFEAPVIIMFMARMGIVTPQWLASKRRLWVILAFVVAAIVTPTIDPINQSIVAFPLIILLELSILLSRLVYRPRYKSA